MRQHSATPLLRNAFSQAAWPQLLLLLLLLAAGVANASSTDSAAALLSRLSSITSTLTWQHKYTLPPLLLQRARTVAGDERRMEAFMAKLVRGEPVKFALLGSSISEPSRQGGYTDVTWHGLLHRWLELTFTPCGKQLGLKTVRTRQSSYDAHHRHSCNASSIKLVDLSMGATSAILTEKCLLKEDKLPRDIDLALIEYTATAAHRSHQLLDTVERRALERMMRHLLNLPRSPAVIMFHAWSPTSPEGGTLGPEHFGPGTEDFHNLLAMHYGQVQVISARAVLYDLLKRHHFNHSNLYLYEPDGLHPMGPGQHIYGDMLISYFQTVARKVMALALAKELLPALPASTLPSPLDSPAVSYAKDMDNDEVIAWPQTIKAYVMDIDRYPQPRLPDFLIDGNAEHSDGYCVVGQELQKHAVVAEGFHMTHEKRGKWGYIGHAAGDTLVLEFDTTFRGRVKPAAAEERGRVVGKYLDGLGREHDVMAGTVEVLLSYLRTYNRIGNAQVDCVAAGDDPSDRCNCSSLRLEGLWQQRASMPYAQRISVTPHPKCRLQLRILADTDTGLHKFKVVSVVLSELPFHFDSEHVGGIYRQATPA